MAITIDGTNGISQPDNTKLKSGDSDDLQIYHDGSHSYITDAGTGNLYLRTDGAGVIIEDSSSTVLARFLNGNACDFNYNGSKKLETTSSGVSVTGTCTATSFSGDGSSLTGIAGGLSDFDQWRLTSNFSFNTSEVTVTGWGRGTTDGGTYEGTGLSESSGVFSFPSTGKWLIHYNFTGYNYAQGQSGNDARMQTTTNNSTYSDASRSSQGINWVSNSYNEHSQSNSFIFDVTSTTNCKFRFRAYANLSTSSNVFWGSTGENYTGFYVIKLGDT